MTQEQYNEEYKIIKKKMQETEDVLEDLRARNDEDYCEIRAEIIIQWENSETIYNRDLRILMLQKQISDNARREANRSKETPCEDSIGDLLTQYSAIKDELMDYTMDFYDAMLYDIQGYWEQIEENEEDIDKEQLIKQVRGFEAILEGLKAIKYIYG